MRRSAQASEHTAPSAGKNHEVRHSAALNAFGLLVVDTHSAGSRTTECVIHCHGRSQRLDRLPWRTPADADTQSRSTGGQQHVVYQRTLPRRRMQSVAQRNYDGSVAAPIRAVYQRPEDAECASGRAVAIAVFS